MTASGTFSSARNVRSSTAPVRKFLSFVRTNAPPLPGFTCWNSTTVMRPSGRLRVMPFFNSFVEMLTEYSPLGSQHEVFGRVGQGLCAVCPHDDRVLDADAAHSGQVYAGLDGHDIAADDATRGGTRHPGVLVDLDTHSVTCAMTEQIPPARFADDVAARGVDGL